MSSPEINAEILETFQRKVETELPKIYDQLNQIGLYFLPETLTPEIVQTIQDTLDKLGQEAKSLNQLALAEVLTQLNLNFYILHTIGTVENQEKFAREASLVYSQLETVLLMMPTTSAATLQNIEQRRERQY